MNEPAKNLTFEQALQQLEAVVRDLESTETGLDKSLARYEDGVQLLKRCREILDAAEQKIRQLTGVDAQGQPITREFEPPAADERAANDRDDAAKREPAAAAKRTTGRTPRRAMLGTAANEKENEEDLFP